MPAIEKENKEIDKLSVWNFAHTKLVPDGYDWKSIPEATPENMVILMNKINELIDLVNILSVKAGIKP